jgi:hypothetical protein
MATKEAFREELNPFLIAKQQFNRAADYLDLELSMNVLEKQATINCLDSSEDGWRRRAGV